MSNPTIALTQLTFDLPMYPALIRKFRGAVAESVRQHEAVFERAGVPTQVFHNHTQPITVPAGSAPVQDGNDPGRTFDYPLVQYKIRHKRASIVGIGTGAQAVQLWFSLVGEQLRIDGQDCALEVYAHEHRQWKPALSDTLYRYRINKWLPLNAEKHKTWKQTARLSERVALLDKALWGHFFHLAEGLGLAPDREQLSLYLNSIDMSTYKSCFGIQKLALDVTFESNLPLPEEIGLGQGVSIGFGKVQSLNSKK